MKVKRVLQRGRRLINQINGRDLRVPIQIKRPKLRLGTDYGGWCFCPKGIAEESIVYSCGVGDDVSFDLAIIERFGADVYAFDPTPRSINWVKSQKLPREFHFFEYGIAGCDGALAFYPPENPDHVSYTILERPATAHNAVNAKVCKLDTIVKMLGHERIDILKMDIEGAEYGVIEDFINSDIEIGQILVEFHHRGDGVALAKTRRAIELLNQKGFQIFDISPTGMEYSFIYSSSEGR